MSHTIHGKKKLLARVRRIAGQVNAVERQLAGDAGCSETLQLVASVRGAVGSLMEELIEQHMREHVARPGLTDEARAPFVPLEAPKELIFLVDPILSLIVYQDINVTKDLFFSIEKKIEPLGVIWIKKDGD